MKKSIKVFVIALITIVLLSTVLYLLVPGFTKQESVYISDYTVSDDGKEMTIKIGVSSSVGYVRKISVHQQHGGKLYLDCYSAFGGINGSWGAKSEYIIQLDEETEGIALYRNSDCYEVVLNKTEDGKWIPKHKLLYGSSNYVDNNGQPLITGEGVQLAVKADYPAAIMVNDTVYYLESEIVAEVDESAILGYTDSYTDNMPQKNGETNFSRELNMPYAKVEGGIAVLYHNEWVLCLAK